mmetsp:Transcript_15021/g.36605  ORF Transcript_15021/g.36605 Transcript_15021/m.36605 type:complete len:138 (+) Transcript_15021:817-1230(+)
MLSSTVVSNSPVARAQVTRDAKKHKKTGGGAPAAVAARVGLREKAANLDLVRTLATDTCRDGHGVKVQMDPEPGLIISLTIFALPSDSHAPESKGRVRVLSLHLNLRGQLHAEMICVLMQLHPIPTCRRCMAYPGSF